MTKRSTVTEIPVYLGLGSNVGNREANLRKAIAHIERLGFEPASESSVYETEPVGLREQPWFLNQVIELRIPDKMASECGPRTGDPETIATMQAETLLCELLNIERAMGRERTVANGPRVIDIDLLLFGDLIIAHSKEDQEWPSAGRTDLFVPHPRMHQRRFVLEPLCEIAPRGVHPVLKKTYFQLLAELGDPSRVRIHEQSSQSA